MNRVKPIRNKERGARALDAGHALGAINNASRPYRESEAKSDLLPHEIALEFARAPVGKIVQGHKVSWNDKKWAIAVAAPYYAPQLRAAQSTGRDQSPKQTEFSTHEEVVAELRRRGLPTTIFDRDGP